MDMLSSSSSTPAFSARISSRALSALYAKFISCGGMTNDVYNKLYKSLVEPVLYYGGNYNIPYLFDW
jgi:hypothetical protein